MLKAVMVKNLIATIHFTYQRELQATVVCSHSVQNDIRTPTIPFSTSI